VVNIIILAKITGSVKINRPGWPGQEEDIKNNRKACLPAGRDAKSAKMKHTQSTLFKKTLDTAPFGRHGPPMAAHACLPAGRVK